MLLHHFCLAAAAGPTSGLAFSPLQAPGQGRLGHWLLKYAQLQLSLSCSPRSQLSHSEPQSNLCPKFAIVSLRLTFWFMNKELFLHISHWLVCDDVMWCDLHALWSNYLWIKGSFKWLNIHPHEPLSVILHAMWKPVDINSNKEWNYCYLLKIIESTPKWNIFLQTKETFPLKDKCCTKK